jgi:hypothetical protein
MLPVSVHMDTELSSEAQPLGEIQASLIPRIASGVADSGDVGAGAHADRGHLHLSMPAGTGGL